MRISNRAINRTLILAVFSLLYASIASAATTIEMTTADWINTFGNINMSYNEIMNIGNASIIGNLSVEGNLSVDTNTLFVDSTLNRVGIGTTAPTQKLHVVGDTNITGSLIVAGQNVTREAEDNVSILYGYNESAGTIIPIRVTETGALMMSVVETGSTDLGTGATGSDLTLSSDLTVDTNTLFVDSSNNKVGIGTTSPYNELVVIGSIGVSGSLNATSINTTGSAYFATSSGNVGIGTTSPYNELVVIGSVGVSGSLNATSINTTGSAYFATSSGNVGIGTASPLVKLDVIGEVNVSGNFTMASGLKVFYNGSGWCFNKC